MLKLKFTSNLAILDIPSNGLDTIIFDLKEMLGVLDLRSLCYYKIKQGILQQNLSKYYKFELADLLCEEINKFINTLKKEKRKQKKNTHDYIIAMKENMSDREILEKYIDLEIPVWQIKRKRK